MKKSGLILLGLAFAIFHAAAQDMSYGFRAGLSFSKIDGPAEEGEMFNNRTGFHIGAALGMSFTDIWGLRAEVMYSQKGTKNDYEGNSYLQFQTSQNQTIFTTGNRKVFINTANSYIDVPVTVFARVTSWLELSAGLNAGVLVASRATGELIFNSNRFDPITFELDYNYTGDEAGEGNSDNTIAVRDKQTGNTYNLPSTIGAYFMQTEKKENLYKTLDFGAVGGLLICLNRGLYFGGRGLYGFANVTNEAADLSQKELENNVPLPRNDKDKNITLQASVGFNF